MVEFQPNVEDLDGFDELKDEDKAKIRTAWEVGHVAEEDIPETAKKTADTDGAEDEDGEKAPKKKRAPKKKKDEEAEDDDAEKEKAPARKRAKVRRPSAVFSLLVAHQLVYNRSLPMPPTPRVLLRRRLPQKPRRPLRRPLPRFVASFTLLASTNIPNNSVEGCY